MKRNSMGDPTTFTDWLAAEGYPPSAYLTQNLEFAHRQLIERLESIKASVDVLLRETKGSVDDAWYAVMGISSGARASGPINTQYQDAVRQAARIEALIRGYRNGVAMMREEAAS